jgi:hypothetical protein
VPCRAFRPLHLVISHEVERGASVSFGRVRVERDRLCASVRDEENFDSGQQNPSHAAPFTHKIVTLSTAGTPAPPQPPSRTHTHARKHEDGRRRTPSLPLAGADQVISVKRGSHISQSSVGDENARGSLGAWQDLCMLAKRVMSTRFLSV